MLLAKLKIVSLALLAAGAVSAAVAQVASGPAGTDQLSVAKLIDVKSAVPEQVI